jgi:hypothetical protein
MMRPHMREQPRVFDSELIIRLAEPGEDWSWCYADQVAFSVVGG